jgi:hypothetical protein
MSQPNLAAMAAIAERLDRLGQPYAFVGGAIVNLLIDHPGLSPARPTNDVDVILEVLSAQRYSDLEARLRDLGFSHDVRGNAPLCRWLLGPMTVDIMPTDGGFLGLNTTWFKEALATAAEREFSHHRLRLVSPVAFLATKYTAFVDRGDGDYYASHDLEDFITVIDGRENIVAEVGAAPPALRRHIITQFARCSQALRSLRRCLVISPRTAPASNDCRCFGANFSQSLHSTKKKHRRTLPE